MTSPHICSLLDQKPPEAISSDQLNQALPRWFKLGLLGADWELNEAQSFCARIGKLAVNIHTSSERLRKLLMPLFSQTGSVIENAEDTFEVVELDGLGHIFYNKACIARCAA